MQNNDYILGVGDIGKERLDILNDVFKQTSHSLLLQAGISKGMSVLEIGCGTGNMTCWLAEQVGSEGQVYAVDISKEQLAIAIERAKKRGLTNIHFIESSVFDVKNLIQFDMVYSRLVLMHVTNPYKALQVMQSFVKPEGVLICEEVCNSVSSYPPCAAYLKSRQLLLKLAELKELDFDVGEKLHSYFRSLKLDTLFMNYVQPIYKSRREKLLIPLFIQEAKSHYIKQGFSEETEIEKMCEEIYDFIGNENNFISFPKTMQIIGKKSVN